VTAKLVLVDLSGTGSVARIVSFLGAGLLMVGIGYLSPIPPVSAPPATGIAPRTPGEPPGSGASADAGRDPSDAPGGAS